MAKTKSESNEYPRENEQNQIKRAMYEYTMCVYLRENDGASFEIIHFESYLMRVTKETAS